MRRTLPTALAAAFVLAACQDTSSPAAPDLDVPSAAARSAAPGTVDVIVTLDPSFAPGGHADNRAAAADVARGMGFAARRTYGTALFGFAATIPEGRLNALGRDPRVLAFEFDQIATVLPGPGAAAPPPDKCRKNCDGGGGEDPPSAQETPWGITRVGGSGSGATGTAWILDTGVDLTHPDLNVDAARSVHFASGKDADDKNGHGTHVAGTIAAIDNGIDVVGVAAGATVVAVKVLGNSGSGSYSDVIAGVDHVAAYGQNGDVANMSLSGPVSDALDAAVTAAAATGVKFALAAGNNGSHANNRSPARANGPNIYTVSAIDSSDGFASFSNYGNPPVDFAAPGVGVLSLKAGGGTVTYSGTSMAAPHVAGILLLGNVSFDGYAIGDPDGSADRIAHR